MQQMCKNILSSVRDYFVNKIDETCNLVPELLGYKK